MSYSLLLRAVLPRPPTSNIYGFLAAQHLCLLLNIKGRLVPNMRLVLKR